MQSFNNVDDARAHAQIAHVPSFRILLPVLVALATLGSLHADPLDHWTQRVPGTNAHLSAVAYGAGRFVAVGQGGVRLSSSNGADWAVAPAGLETNFHSVAHGAGLFVAVGAGGTVHTSADGENWVARDSNTTNGLLCVRWVKDRFLASGGLGTLLSSTNGVDWLAWDSGTPNQLTGIAYGAGLFVVVGQTNTHLSTILRSTNGETWSAQEVAFGSFYDLIYHGDRFLALNIRGRVNVSTNGQDWTGVFSTVNSSYNFAIAHVHDRFLAVGGPFIGGNQKIVSSPDGFAWKLHPITFSHSGTLRGVAVGNNTAVAVGDGGLIIQSDSLFRLHAGMTLPGGGREWILHGEAGRPYRFQYSSEATGAPWLDLTNFLSTNDVITLRDPLPPSPTNRFYRVVTP